MLTSRARSLFLSNTVSSAFKFRNLCGVKWASNSVQVQGKTSAKPISVLPTPRGALPFLGHHLLLKEHKHKISQLYCDLSLQLGPIFRIKLPAGYSMVIVCVPEAAEELFRNEGQYPTRVPAVADNMQWLIKKKKLPIPFVFMSGEEWKRSRSAHNKQIMPSNIYSYTPGMNKVALQLMRNLKNSRNKQGYVENRGPFLSNFAMEASGYFALGANLDLDGGDDLEATAFQHAVENYINSVGEIALSLPLYRLFPTPLYHRASRAIDSFYNLGKKYLDRNMDRIQESLQKGERVKGQSLIEQWMLEKEMTEAEIILSAIAMFGAGVDTTAHTGTFMLYELSKHPEVQEKVRSEVLSVLGDSGEADAESLQKMPYLIQVIKETQRVYPVATKLARTLNTGIDLLGYHIPAKTIIVYSAFTVTKDAKYFNEPQSFNPDRWGKGSEKIHPFALLPFGFGPRACWGRRFSEVELKILLSHVCRNFILESDDAPETRLPTTEKNILRPGIPVEVKFTLR